MEGRDRGARKALAQLRARPSASDADEGSEDCALFLEAIVATLEGRSDAADLAARADSMVRTARFWAGGDASVLG